MPRRYWAAPLRVIRGAVLAFFIERLALVSSCYIQGYDSGICALKETLEAQNQLRFCGDIVYKYDACIPRPHEYFTSHNLKTKDRWIQNTFNAIVQERKRHEMNQTLQELGENEYGPKYDPETGDRTEFGGDKVERRFWNGNYRDPNGERFAANGNGAPLSDCELAYKHYMCYLNFPRCDSENKSLVLCRSVCENYVRACHISDDLNRCGPNKYMGAEEAEVPELNEETKEMTQFIRGIYPGWPFRDYMETGFITTEEGNVIYDDSPLVRCTPSVKGVGSGIQLHIVSILISATIQIALALCA